MSRHHIEVKHDPCPNCNKPEGAFMGSSEWGHNLLACSDGCGFEIKGKIEQNMSTQEYKITLDQFYTLKAKLFKLWHKGINGRDPYLDF